MADILVVDDEVEVGKALTRVLRRRGMSADQATSGAQALEMLTDVKVLLTDQRMPGMTGLELIEAVRRRRPDVLCCLMSGDTSVAPPEGGAAVAACLAKPLSNDALITVVRSLLEGARGAA